MEQKELEGIPEGLLDQLDLMKSYSDSTRLRAKLFHETRDRLMEEGIVEGDILRTEVGQLTLTSEDTVLSLQYRRYNPLFDGVSLLRGETDGSDITFFNLSRFAVPSLLEKIRLDIINGKLMRVSPYQVMIGLDLSQFGMR